MPFPFDFFNMVRRPEDLMRTADFNPDARKLPVPVPVPVPGPAPVPVLPPAPIARPQMPVPMANPVPAVPLTPEMKQGLEMKQPPASYALMKDTFTGGAAPLDRQTVRMMEKQYVDEQSQRKGAGRFFRNLGAGALAGLEGGGAIGALTGAATGAIGGAISPKFGARLQYGAFERPNVERAYGQQQAEQMMQMKQALDLAKLAQERSQQMKYEAEAERASRPVLHNATPEQNVFGIGPDGNPSVIYRGQSKPPVQPAPKGGWITRGGQAVYLPDLARSQPGDAPYEKPNPLADLKKQQMEREASRLSPQEEKELDAEAERRVLQGFGPQERAGLAKKYTPSGELIGTGQHVLNDEMKKWKEMTKSALRGLAGKDVNFNLNRDQYEGGVQNLMQKHGMSRDDAWRLMQIIGFRIAQ